MTRSNRNRSQSTRSARVVLRAALLVVAFATVAFHGNCPGLDPRAYLELHAAGVDKYVGHFAPATEEDAGNGWTKHTFDTADGEGPICIDGSPLTVFTRGGGHPKKLAIFLDDLTNPATECRILLASFDGFAQSDLDRLVQTVALGASERLGVSSELVVKSDREVLRHDTMVSRCRAPNSLGFPRWNMAGKGCRTADLRPRVRSEARCWRRALAEARSLVPPLPSVEAIVHQATHCQYLTRCAHKGCGLRATRLEQPAAPR